jgi:hypothetical protein
MDRVFICGIHDRESIASELVSLLHEKGCSVTDLQVIKIEEGCDLDFNLQIFDNIMELTEIILAGLKTFKSVCVMVSKEVNDKHFSVVMYLMFVKTVDLDLFNALSMI